jgi:hypothetical protein
VSFVEVDEVIEFDEDQPIIGEAKARYTGREVNSTSLRKGILVSSVCRSPVLAIHPPTDGGYIERDGDGKTILLDDSQVSEIIRSVHYHEGAGELEAILRSFISPESTVSVYSSIRERCREYVRGCEACRMSRPRVAQWPIRISDQGENLEPTKDERIAINERSRLQVRRVDSAKKRLAALVRSPMEQLHMDIVGPWQFGHERVYVITCLDNVSNYVNAEFLESCPTSEDCGRVLKRYVTQITGTDRV